jgi:hypothetical protein
MLVLSLAGLAILIFLLNLSQGVFQQWITNGRTVNEKITTIVSSLTAAFAFLAAGAAIASGWIFYGQLQEMREEKRAWVGPVSSGFGNGLPPAGNPGTVEVKIHNTGREPANDVFSELSPYSVTLAENQQGVSATHVAEYVEKCRQRQPIIGAQVVFPTAGFSSYTTGRLSRAI